jgi:hypothetical protein
MTHPKRPRDPNQLAKTGEKPNREFTIWAAMSGRTSIPTNADSQVMLIKRPQGEHLRPPG